MNSGTRQMGTANLPSSTKCASLGVVGLKLPKRHTVTKNSKESEKPFIEVKRGSKSICTYFVAGVGLVSNREIPILSTILKTQYTI